MIEQAQPDSMSGGPYSLAFTTNLPQGAGVVGGLQDVALQLGPGGALVLRYTPHPPGLPLGPAPVPKTDILATGLYGRELQLFADLARRRTGLGRPMVRQRSAAAGADASGAEGPPLARPDSRPRGAWRLRRLMTLKLHFSLPGGRY